MYRRPILEKYNGPISAALVLAAFTQFDIPASASSGPFQAKAIFRKRCTACHTFGKGVKVGPDLKGVTERRQRAWLLKFIRSSSNVIQSGDLVATRLFAEFKRERMPDWSDLSFDEIGAIVDYLGANGPEQKEPDERDASTATTSEIEAGRQLFHGEKALTYSGAACHTCHSVSAKGTHADGTLGPDLSNAYVRFQDRALTDFLKRPCVLREPEISSVGYLTPQESFEVKAYLAKTAALAFPGVATAGRTELENHAGDTMLRATKRDTVLSKARLLFAAWPYIALAAFAAGAAARCVFERSRADGIARGLTDAEPFRRARGWWIGSFLILFLGHLAGLLFPSEVLLWNATPARLYCLEATAFGAGLGALAGWACMMRLRLRVASGSVAGQMADIIFLSLLFAVLVSGVAASVLYRWSSSWGALTATPYMLSVLRGKPAVGLAQEMPFLLRLHIFSALGLAPVLPFTSAAPRLIGATYRRFEWLLGPVRCPAQRARTAFADWIARHNPGPRIWPEED